MKKGLIIIFCVSCFLMGMSYSIQLEEFQSQPTVLASSNLEEEIQKYEESLEEEENTFIPYSQNQITNSTSANTAVEGTKVTGIEHNTISKFGQEAANFLKTFVREILRMLVRFIDQLISA